MAYGSSYASEGRELPRLLLILVGGAAHELAHGLNTLIFLLDLDLRGDAYGARRGDGEGSAPANVERAVIGTPPPRPQKGKPGEGSYGTPAPRLLLARLADADGAAVRVARHNDLVADQY